MRIPPQNITIIAALSIGLFINIIIRHTYMRSRTKKKINASIEEPLTYLKCVIMNQTNKVANAANTTANDKYFQARPPS